MQVARVLLTKIVHYYFICLTCKQSAVNAVLQYNK